MPLLFKTPETAEDWRAWSFNHAANHYDWIRVAFEQKGQNLVRPILDPIDPNNLGFWIYNHQLAHNQINTVLGTSGFDLLTIDFTDPEQIEEWLQLNGDEHTRISAALGV